MEHMVLRISHMLFSKGRKGVLLSLGRCNIRKKVNTGTSWGLAWLAKLHPSTWRWLTMNERYLGPDERGRVFTGSILPRGMPLP